MRRVDLQPNGLHPNHYTGLVVVADITHAGCAESGGRR
jgi:hypothetical protein